MALNPDLMPGLSGPQGDPLFNQDPYSAFNQGIEQTFESSIEQPGLVGDLFPVDEEEYQRLLRWARDNFTAADAAREPYAERWRRYYKLYRSYMKRKPNEWKSTVFIPISFWVIETIAPRMVAQLPQWFTEPVGPEDVEPAEMMEELLEWAKDESELYIQLVMAYKSALKYGTAIIKTFHRVDKRQARKIQPLTAPLTMPTPVKDQFGNPVTDMNGEPIITEDVVGEIPAGMMAQKYEYTSYDGPAAECVDIFNFWVAPEAHDLDTARYVIHRTFKELSHIKRLVKEGVYRWPDMSDQELTDISQDPTMERLADIDMGSPDGSDPTRKVVELLEFWTDDGRVITMANRKAIIRVQQNPFDHNEKPFVRLVNYLQEHEFWGVGEIEPLEGLQDLQNALTNSRIDNIRMVLNAMFAVNVNNVEDLRDLKPRPGGVIRLKGDFKPNEVIERIDFGDVTQTAFQEAELVNNFIERVSGISAYQMGLDNPNLNSTATGVAIIQEQGASRFGLKSRLAELMALKRLGRHYGSILQQFTTEERLIRMYGPQGQMLFQTFTPESIQGAIDYSVEAGSPTQTQTARQQNAQTLFELLQGATGIIDPMTGQPVVPTSGVTAALDNLLDTMGVKDKQKYLMATQAPMLPPPQPGGMPAPTGMNQLPPPAPPMDPNQAMAQMGGNPGEGSWGQGNAQRMQAKMQQLFQGG